MTTTRRLSIPLTVALILTLLAGSAANVPRLHVFRQARLLVLEWTLDAGPVAGLQSDAMTEAFEKKAARMDALYGAAWIPWHPLEMAFDYDRSAAWYIKERDLMRAEAISAATTPPIRDQEVNP